MQKQRATSDPPPSTSDSNAGYHQIFSSTLPARVPRNMRIAQPFPVISATDLLGMDVSHTGWIRKEGFGYRNWKSRFMVLHHGCIYYFKETDSNTPKGKFPLNGYRCFAAPDRERADRYPYVFKLVPDDEEHRTYYISSPSKSEMEGWMKSINEDIELYCPSEYDYVDALCDVSGNKHKTCPTVPKKVPAVNPRVPGINGTLPNSFPSRFKAGSNFSPLLPPKPKVVQEDTENPEEEDFYEPVDGLFDDDEEHYLPVVHDPDADSSPGQNIHIPSNGNRPVPPARPKPPLRPEKPQDMRESENEESEEDSGEEDSGEELYLDLVKERDKSKKKQVPGSPKKNDASPTSPERPIPVPPQNGDDGSDDIDVTYVSVVNPEPPKRMPRPTPIPLPRKEKKEFDYLPADCLKPDMHKNQAKVFLELGRTAGVYIVNFSQTSDTRMSLSVWLVKGVKHYLIFKRQEKYTLDPSLGKEEHFADLRQLVKYYYSHPLPKSDQRLTAPFAAK